MLIAGFSTNGSLPTQQSMERWLSAWSCSYHGRLPTPVASHGVSPPSSTWRHGNVMRPFITSISLVDYARPFVAGTHTKTPSTSLANPAPILYAISVMTPLKISVLNAVPIFSMSWSITPVYV